MGAGTESVCKGRTMTLTAEKLVGIAMTNPINVQLTSRLPALGH
ncbi:hypothetical protein PG5_60770 [Pseudomonas sp. G5(2012)]|nr:hypothetical protein PG5_60770 [Pseudomonas sp. G5(2012)]